MNREVLKMQAFYLTFFSILTGIVLYFVFSSAASLLMGLEELQRGNFDSLVSPLFFGVGYGFTSAAIGFVLYQIFKLYLDARTLKVPEVCHECNSYLDIYDVKWIEPEKKAECPHCGIPLKVTKVWVRVLLIISVACLVT